MLIHRLFHLWYFFPGQKNNGYIHISTKKRPYLFFPTQKKIQRIHGRIRPKPFDCRKAVCWFEAPELPLQRSFHIWMHSLGRRGFKPPQMVGGTGDICWKLLENAFGFFLGVTFFWDEDLKLGNFEGCYLFVANFLPKKVDWGPDFFCYVDLVVTCAR